MGKHPRRDRESRGKEKAAPPAPPRPAAPAPPPPPATFKERLRQLWREHGKTVCILFAAAFVIRVFFVLQMSRTTYFELANIDIKSYQDWAKEILEKGWMPRKVFYQSGLYAYFLAGVWKVFGFGLWAPRIIQVVMSSLSVTLVYGIGARLFSRRVGTFSAALLCLYGPLIVKDIMLLKTPLVIFLSLVSFLLLLDAAARRSARAAALSGLFIGLAVVGVGQWLVALPFLTFWAGWGARGAAPRRRVLLALVFAAGWLVPIAPVSAWNSRAGGGFLLTSADSGLNLYLGNNERSTGLPARPDNLRDIPEFEESDARQIAEKALGRTLVQAEVSRYWAREAVRYIAANPGDAFKGFLRKAVVTLNAYEIPDNYHYSYLRSEFLPSFWLCLTFAFLGPLALAGMLLFVPRWRTLLPLYMVVLSYVAILVIFCVRGRYRMAVIPFMALFAGAAIDAVVTHVRRRSWRALGFSGFIVALCGVFVNRPYCEGAHHDWPPVCLSGTQWYDLEYLKLAYWFQERGTPEGEERAFAYFDKTLEFAVDPKLVGRTWFSIGSLHHQIMDREMKSGRREEAMRRFAPAERAYKKAIAIEYRPGACITNLGAIYKLVGDYDKALAALELADRILPGNDTTLFSLGQVYVRLGRCDDAKRALDRMVAVKPSYAQAAANALAACQPR